MNVLDAIGNTPLIELRRVIPPGSARVMAKLEWANPTGSMKDRMARAAIERAEVDGRLPPDGTVVEYTGGVNGGFARLCLRGKRLPATNRFFGRVQRGKDADDEGDGR